MYDYMHMYVYRPVNEHVLVSHKQHKYLWLLIEDWIIVLVRTEFLW